MKFMNSMPGCRPVWMMIWLSTISYSLLAQETVVHSFTSETARFYDNQLITDGSFLYGVRYDGHVNGNGAVFRIAKDGADFELIHVFDDPINGANPVGTLVISGSTLYGMTVLGGVNNVGVIFKIETDGTGYQKLLDFDVSNGAMPYSSLIISGSVLYGIAQQGGDNLIGVVFRINTDGSGYAKLLDFNGANGQSPVGSLVLAGNTLYGVTARGGSYDHGVIYKLNIDGNGYQILFHFKPTTGQYPLGGLIISGNTLYGTTSQGGSGPGFGSVFMINDDGTGFREYLSFGATNPVGTLTKVDNMLYGMTVNGGYANGVVYSINTDDDTFQELHAFNIDDGQNPSGSLLYDGQKFFGYVPGGTYGYGVIFSMEANGNNFMKVKDFTSTNTGYDPRGTLAFLGTRAYGVARAGGKYNKGVIYSIRHDGTGYTPIHDFDGTSGAFPETSLLVSDNLLYGVTLMGGVDHSGVLFSTDTTAAGYEALHHFSYSGGSFPAGSLTDGGGDILYGTASAGGLANEGMVFRYNKETDEFASLFDFSATDALRPTGTMVLSDSILYGMSLGGVGDGVVFSLKIDGSGFKKIVDRDHEIAGRYGNALVLSDSILYVTTRQGGINDVGVLFSVETDGSDFKKLFEFNYLDGGVPEGELIVLDSVLYGMTMLGGPDNTGTAYQINTDGRQYRVLFTFDDTTFSTSGRMASGRIKAGEARVQTTGSLALHDKSLFAAFTSASGETKKGSIVRYRLYDAGVVTSVEPETRNVISAFPNPARDYITLDGPIPSSFRLLDAMGRSLPVNLLRENSIDVSSLPVGMYYLVVRNRYFRFVKN